MLVIPFIHVSAQFRGGYAGVYDSEVSSGMRSDVAYLASEELDGRAAGSEGEKEAAAYIGDRLASSGAVMISDPQGDVFGMKLPDGDTLTSRNVIGYIPGCDKDLKDRFILIGARMDNAGSVDVNIDSRSSHRVFYGANGNASGAAMLLALAGRLSESRICLKRSVLLVGFGSSLQQHAGAWYFLNRSFPGVPSIDAMIDLDMVGMASGGFYAYTAGNSGLDAIMDDLSRTLQPIKPERVPLQPCESDFVAFLDKQIPSVLFTTGRYREYMTERDTPDILEYGDMERELEYLFNFTVALASAEKLSFLSGQDAAGADQGRRDRDVVQYFDCDRKPTFLGSSDPRDFLGKWVYQYLKYPPEAVRQGIQGKVLVDFVIDRNGDVTDVTVRKGVHELLDAEAVRVIEASPRWRPGYLGGKKVRAELSLYVEFKLERKK